METSVGWSGWIEPLSSWEADKYFAIGSRVSYLLVIEHFPYEVI